MIINSEDSNEYLDTNEKEDTFNDLKKNNILDSRIDEYAVKQVDNLFNSNHTDFFEDLPSEGKDEIKSVFSPKILIGKNSGFGNTEAQSKWNSSFSGSEFDVQYNENIDSSTTSTSTQKCEQYVKARSNIDSSTISESDDGNLIVKDYQDSKTWFPGYTYLPPSNWDVPQKRAPVCVAPSPNALKLTGLMDRGLPLNVLELNPGGQIAQTENSVKLTNVGSILPKFSYEEQPFSKPYV